MSRPEIVTDEYLEFLDYLRDSGIINMLGCAPYLLEEFPLSASEAFEVAAYWMESFGKEDR